MAAYWPMRSVCRISMALARRVHASFCCHWMPVGVCMCVCVSYSRGVAAVALPRAPTTA